MDNVTSNFGLSTSSSKRYKSDLKSQSDVYIDFEEIEGDADLSSEYPCPFCSEDFDLVGLCCHIDEEHSAEAESVRKLKLRKGEPHSAVSLLGKELQDGYLQHILEGSSSEVSSSTMAPDPLLSFIYNVPAAYKSQSMQSTSSNEVSLSEKSSVKKMLERDIRPSPLSEEDQKEKAQRCEFVQGLLFSTFLDDCL